MAGSLEFLALVEGRDVAYGRVGLNNTSMAAPLAMIVTTAALRSYDLIQERARGGKPGGSRLKAIFTITLPQIKFSVVTAALLSFLTSFEEVTASYPLR